MNPSMRIIIPVTIALMCAVSGWQVPAGAATTTNSLQLRPVQGPPGTQVRVDGQINDLGCVAIWFVDSVGASWFWAAVPSGSIYLTRHVPAGAALGDAEVRTRFGIFDSGTCRHFRGDGPVAAFTVTNGPGIFGFTPHRGPVGTVVTINGVGFNTASNVLFHGRKTQYTIVSDSEIMAWVPSGATTGQIRIHTADGPIGSGPSFTVT